MAPKTPKVLPRQFDTDSLARFMELEAIAASNRYELSIHRVVFKGRALWMVYLFNPSDDVVARGRGETCGGAVAAAHLAFFSKNVRRG